MVVFFHSLSRPGTDVSGTRRGEKGGAANDSGGRLLLLRNKYGVKEAEDRSGKRITGAVLVPKCIVFVLGA